MRVIWLLLLGLLLLPAPLHAQGTPIDDLGVEIAFPEQITFRAQLPPGVAADQVQLEYGVARRNCTEQVIAVASPQSLADTPDQIAWTWDMNESGSLPPGATIWYRWRITSGGSSSVGETYEVRWLDDPARWQQISRNGVNLYWYAGSNAFAEDLHATAVQAVRQLVGLVGVTPDRPIDLYIYDSPESMSAALLGAPSWAGGVAFPDYNITIIGINPEIIVWGRSTITHELTHLLIGQLGGPCGGIVPTWLNEGIAVYNEGALDPRSEAALREAVRVDTVLSPRALSGAFSAHPDRANLAYAQSYSLVRFLVDTYGRERLLALFAALSEGSEIDAAMNAIYGFDQNGLDARWRAALAAVERPLPADVAPVQATIAPLAAQSLGRLPLPTPVPTLAPTGLPVAAAASATQAAAQPASAAVPLVPLLIAGLVFLVGCALSGYAGLGLAASYRSERRMRGSR